MKLVVATELIVGWTGELMPQLQLPDTPFFCWLSQLLGVVHNICSPKRTSLLKIHQYWYNRPHESRTKFCSQANYKH